MNNKNVRADISTEEIKREFTYAGTVVLTLDINYPAVSLKDNQRAQARINSRYRAQARQFYRYASGTLYRGAVREYKDSMKNDFPFRPYDAVMRYETAMNGDCTLSGYYDRYTYTGGAHGNTIRASDTFSLETGRRLGLSAFFRPGEDYRKNLISQILLQADGNMKKDPGIYFEDYRTLIVKYFNPESFFLTPEGINIYYQQYEIAPYSTGIVVFELAYESVGAEKPRCGM